MPAYFIVDLEVTDPAGFDEYRQLVPATIQQYGGRYVVRGGAQTGGCPRISEPRTGQALVQFRGIPWPESFAFQNSQVQDDSG